MSELTNIQKRLLSVKELSEYLGIAKDTIYTWVSQKKIKYIKIGRLTRFDTEDIEEWLKNNKVEIKYF